jgi:hypothetical protein
MRIDPSGDRTLNNDTEVDSYGVPSQAFGLLASPELFEILGRVVAVQGKIEYLQDRLAHLPPSETSSVRKVEQFLKRCNSGRAARNALVHSRWVFGADMKDPDVILGFRYKTRKVTSGTVATASISDVEGSEKEHDVVRHTIESLRKLLQQDVVTMQIGEQAYSEIMLKWAAQQSPGQS